MALLLSLFPVPLLDDVLRASGRAGVRRRTLPARLVLYHVLALALFSDRNYAQVMRLLLDGLSWSSHDLRTFDAAPSVSAISRARARLGPDPLRMLFERTTPRPPPRPGPLFGGLRGLSLDGVSLDVAGSRENASLGYPAPTAPFPQIRVVALADSTTHALLDATLGACGTPDATLTDRLLRGVRPGTLLAMPLSARSPGLLRAADRRGAHLLLGGGPDETRRGLRTVRTANGVLHTTLDPGRATASALAACYARRWTIAPALAWLRPAPAGGVALRSRNPEMVVQEVWALLCLYQALNALTCQSSATEHLKKNSWSTGRFSSAARR